MATVDPTDAALVGQQRIEFANLVSLPIRSYAEKVVRASPPSPGGSGTWLPGGGQFRASIRWDADALPAAEQWGFSATVRSGRLVLTADEADDPWAVTPLAARSADGNLVMVDARDTSTLTTLSADMGLAIAQDRPYWRGGWTRRFVVFGTTDSELFDRRWLGGQQFGDFAGYVTTDPTTPPAGTPGDAGVEPRVVLDLNRIDDSNDTTVTVLRHELTHAASAAAARPATATWVTEGYADDASFGGVPLGETRSADVVTALQDGTIGSLTLPAGRDGEGKHSFYVGDVDRNYATALLAFQYMTTTYGRAMTLSFFEAAQGAATHMASAFAVLGTTQAAFISGWNVWARSLSG